jgi:hypothetical protein
MLKSEREILLKLCREREQVAKKQTDVRAVQRTAEFESQLATDYSWDSDEILKELFEEAKAIERKLNERAVRILEAEGVPRAFAPSCYVSWSSRGMNASKNYCAELRRVFKAKNEQDTVQAKLKIQQTSLEIRTQLMADGLESAEAKAFLAAMPTPEQLMPVVTVEQVRRMIAPSGEDHAEEDGESPDEAGEE